MMVKAISDEAEQEIRDRPFLGTDYCHEPEPGRAHYRCCKPKGHWPATRHSWDYEPGVSVTVVNGRALLAQVPEDTDVVVGFADESPER